ncbi:phosphotransferase family protein [Kribbella sp. NPDC058693]|uniref:phosphotransferase family protein n=1 Tax=Kribbella sp. NPDC058693 TaxID=3346602 RepID=UPI00365546F0
MEWVADSIGGAIRSVQALHDDQGPWRVGVDVRGRERHFVLRSLTPRIDAALIATGAAALEVAEVHGVWAPRLVAKDLDRCVTLETVASGNTTWPRTLPVARLRAADAALARVHAIRLEPSPHLPLRIRPIAVDDFARDRRLGNLPTTPLLRQADELIRSLPQPQGETVFVHGDVWPGNLTSTCTLIDWKTAGVGNPGVDLGELRKQIAIAYGATAPHIVEAWESASGRPATDIPYWDAVAALNTPTTLYNPEATARRDAFLRAALSQL